MKAARSGGVRGPARAAGRDTPLPRAEEMEHLPVVALVGRPNTGKSTLFNRLTRSRRALVAPTPGVTRDRNIAVADHGGRRFLLFDTGGFEADEREELGKAVRLQALVAAQEADVVVLVVDGRAGLNPLDTALAHELAPVAQAACSSPSTRWTRRSRRTRRATSTRWASTRCTGSRRSTASTSTSSWTPSCGTFPEPVPAPEAEGVEEQAPTAVAIIGRPNVGKSSLLNRLVGYERSIVTAVPGTTRDAIDTPLTRDGRAYLLVDTAGVRRRAQGAGPPRARQRGPRAARPGARRGRDCW